MSFQYTNRCGQVYFLHQGTTKTGKPKYFFSMTLKDNCLDVIPNDFEVYENPNKQVFLIKKEERLITDIEKQIVIAAVEKNKDIYSIVDIRKKYITIYTAKPLSLDFGDFPMSQFLTSDRMKQFLNYMPEMRFELIDVKNRSFETKRYCYRGSIDDWIFLGAPDKLSNLVKKYVVHLGKESFYELF